MNTYISLVGGCYLGNRDIGVPSRLYINTLNFVLSGKKWKTNEEEKKRPLCRRKAALAKEQGKTGKRKRSCSSGVARIILLIYIKWIEKLNWYNLFFKFGSIEQFYVNILRLPVIMSIRHNYLEACFLTIDIIDKKSLDICILLGLMTPI